jgi:hypothetical protein
MAVPKPHRGPAAAADRDWGWSEHERERTDALLDKGGWKAMAQAHAWYDDSGGDPPERTRPSCPVDRVLGPE